MSHSHDDSTEAMVARSTLLATAGEFIPRAHRPEQSRNSAPYQLQDARHDQPPTPIGSYNQRYQNEFHSRNREPKNGGNRFKKNERESVNGPPQDGRLWRDGNREGRKKGYNSEYQANSSGTKPRPRDTGNEEADFQNGPSSSRQWQKERKESDISNGPRSRREWTSRYHYDDDIGDKFKNNNSNGFSAEDASDGNTAGNSDPPKNASKNPSNLDGANGHRPRRFCPRIQHEYQNGGRYKRQNSYEPSGGNGENWVAHGTRVEANQMKRQYNHLKNDSNKSRVETGRNQMEVLISQLTKGTLECLVCCEHVRQTDQTWSCQICHHVMHLRCVTKWARASRAEEGWRCPACQHVSTTTPCDYYCFCGKTVDPSWNRSDCPHTCGAVCGQSRSAPCPHRCTLPCHPGPCPPCRLYITRECGCGRASRTVICADFEPIVCGAPCSKILNCSNHKCSDPCHVGSCPPCSEIVKQVCFCSDTTREVPCTEQSVGVFSFCCGSTCGKKLECANHECSLLCHEGPCPPCSLLPAAIESCPCGKSLLKDLDVPPRTSCTDSVPTCNATCEKLLPCGEPGARHECQSKCHEGFCPPCPGETSVRCRCGHMNKTLLCSELLVRADDARCTRKCSKRRSCGKHKCREPCCIDIDHICPLICTRTLSCGLHRCDTPCHAAFCRPCHRDSYEELLCECGAEVILPPVPCGTRRPACTLPCSRAHSCSHPPTHNCHSGTDCPPCTVLVAKRCYGSHELRKTVFCHLDGFSCGIPCGKPMPCGRHGCTLPCHEGPCLRDGQICTQPCTEPRPGCGHNCSMPCHEPPCPDAPCKEMVKVSCECGERYSTRVCVDNAREYQRIATAQLASKMADLAAGQTVDLNEMATTGKKISYKTLECTEECKVIERNRRLAVGLQIRNPDLSAKLTPRYSEFLRTWAKKDPRFCQIIHDKLTDLVQLAKQSKQKSRSYSFDSMNWDKRQFIHEYSDHFGCESVAYDQEPNRNIVATALRDKSWLPGLSLLEVIQRENGARKVPLPSNSKSKLVPTLKTMEVLPMRVPGSSASHWALPTAPTSSAPVPDTAIDYFDMQSPSGSTTQVDYFDMK